MLHPLQFGDHRLPVVGHAANGDGALVTPEVEQTVGGAGVAVQRQPHAASVDQPDGVHNAIHRAMSVAVQEQTGVQASQVGANLVAGGIGVEVGLVVCGGSVDGDDAAVGAG